MFWAGILTSIYQFGFNWEGVALLHLLAAWMIWIRESSHEKHEKTIEIVQFDIRWLDCSMFKQLETHRTTGKSPIKFCSKNVSFIDFARSTPLWPSVRNTLYVHIPSAFKQWLVFIKSSLSKTTFWIIGLDLGHCDGRYSYNFQGQGWWQSAASVDFFSKFCRSN